MAGQRPRISIFNAPESNNLIRRQQQEWDRVNTPLTQQESDYITQATGGKFGRPATIGDAERISAILKTFAPPAPKYGKVWNPTNKQYEQGALEPGTPLEAPVEEKDEYFTAKGPLGSQLVKKQKGVDYTGLTVDYEKPPPHYLDRTDKYGRPYQVEEGTGKRTSPENPPPLESDRITAAEKAKQDKLKGIAAERSRVDDDIKQLNARKKGDESDVYIDEEIKNLTAKQNNLDLQYDKLGGDVRDLGRDPIVKQSSEEREASRKAFINTYGLPSNEPPAGEETHGGFGVQEGETTQAEDMSNVGAGDANVNKQKQADIDRDQILLNRKYQKEPVGSRKMKNGIIWTKTADRGWVHS